MVSYFYKKIAIILVVISVMWVLTPATTFSGRVLWPSEMNLDNDLANLDYILPENATTSNSKKGFLLSGDPKEIFTLGAGHVAINVTLSGKGHTLIQYLQGLKKRGIKITLILVNDKAPVGVNLSAAPLEYQKPYFYMIDFAANNGDWQRYNFERVLSDYGRYVDNWVIGNEINSQLYNFYGKANVKDYTKVYCDTFKICYEKIKEKNKDANVFISFDQAWDIPNYDAKDRRYDKRLDGFRYNAKEQIILINNYLSKNIDWGIALHPYPAPLESADFWDDEYAGYDKKSAKNEFEMPYLLTLKNFEIAISFLAEKRFLNKDNEVRKFLISEFAVTSHDGERKQAAGLYYLWEKIEKNPFIVALLYNAQTDLPDGFNFGLTSDKNKKRLAWAVFKDMDREEERGWCKDLLDSVLEENGVVDIDTVLFYIASLSEATKQ